MKPKRKNGTASVAVIFEISESGAVSFLPVVLIPGNDEELLLKLAAKAAELTHNFLNENGVRGISCLPGGKS